MTRILLLILLVACGKDDNTAAPAESATVSLVGKWVSECEVYDDGSLTTHVEITDTEYTSEVWLTLNGTACEAADIISTRKFSYKGTPTADGVQNLDFKVISSTYVAATNAGVADANGEQAWGYSDWVVGTGKPIAGKKATEADELLPNVGDSLYSAVKRDDDKLYIADDDTNDGKTGATRKTQLSTEPLTKE